MRLNVAVINVPTSAGEENWKRCFRKADRRADIFGINEVFDRDHKRINLRLAKRRGLGQWGTKAGPNPVYWDSAKYRFVSGRQIKLHGRSDAKRWPGFNAARYLTEVVLYDPREDVEIAVLNTHWVPRGRKVSEPWRAWARTRSKRKLRRLVRRHQAAGRVVPSMGDYNIGGPFKMPRGFTWLRGHGVDKIGVAVPVGVRLERHTSRPFLAPTDHRHGVAASVQLSA